MELKSKLLFLLGSLFVVMGLQAENKSTSIVFSEQGYNNAQSITICNIGDDITAEFSIGSNPKNDPKYYDTGTALRLYSGNTMTISGDDNVTINTVELVTQSGEYNVEKSSSVSIGKLTIKDTKATISYINSNSVTYTQGGSSGHVRIISIKIIYSVDESIVVSPNKPETPVLTESCEFFEKQMVEITNTTVGATIYYTTDGSEPSADNGIKYESPFTITETTTVKAIAVKEGESSDIVEATYTKIVPECVLPVISPQGGDTPESAIPILQHSSITITPAEYNIVTYSINEGVETTTTEAVSISADEIGEMKLTVISACGDNRLEATYYYAVVETAPIITATLTREEIGGADKTPYNEKASLKHDMGVWSGYMAINNQYAPNLQINNKDGYHIQSPVFPGKIISVAVTFNASTTVFHGFVVMPSDFKGENADESTKGCLGSALYKGKEDPTSIVTLSSEVNSFRIYSTGGAIYVAGIEVVYEKPMDYTLKVGSTGWSTLYLGLDTTIPDGVTCYTISSIANETAALTPIATGTLPAYTGVIINATPNTQYTFRYKNSYGGSEGISNLLEGSIAGTQISGGGYVLSILDGVVGLYAAKLTNGTFLNNANKAYLPASAVPASLQSNGLRFEINETTAIDDMEAIPAKQHSVVIYDLMGRRVENMEKGIYIVNGRKVVKN